MIITALFICKYLVIFSYFCKGKYNNYVHFFIHKSGSLLQKKSFNNIFENSKICCFSTLEKNALKRRSEINVNNNEVINICRSNNKLSQDLGSKNTENNSYHKKDRKHRENRKAKNKYLKKLLNEKDTIYGLSSGNIKVHSAIGIIRISGELSIPILEILLARNVEKRKRKKENEMENEEKGSDKNQVKESYKKKENYNLNDIINVQKKWEPRKIYMGKLFDNENNFIDQVLYAIYKKPNSYTGENIVEIFCHGNPFIVKEIMESINNLNILFNKILAKEEKKQQQQQQQYSSNNTKENNTKENNENNNSIVERGIYEEYSQSATKKDITREGGNIVYILRRNLPFTKIRECYKGEFTRRALENNKMSILEVEGLRELLFCKQKIHKNIAVNYLNGEVGNMYNKLKSKIQRLLMYSQYIIDFEDEHTINEEERSNININFYKKLITIIKTIKNIVNKKSIETIDNIQDILLLGNVNSGKSTFLNCISKYDVSIVTSIKGSTIDIISKNVNINKNIYNFCDSAGVTDVFVQTLCSHKKQKLNKNDKHKILEHMGMRKTLSYLKKRSAACLVLINIKDYIKEVKNIIRILNYYFNKKKCKNIPLVFFCINKCDLLKVYGNRIYEHINKKVKRIIKKYLKINIQKRINKLFFISAKKGYNVNQLLHYINRKMIKNVNLEKNENENIMYFLPFERHKLYLKKALKHLLFIKKNKKILTFDILAEELKLAVNAMNHILGKFKNEKILNEIFEKFCIGK